MLQQFTGRHGDVACVFKATPSMKGVVLIQRSNVVHKIAELGPHSRS